MKRLIVYAAIAIIVSIGGYLVGFQRGAFRSAMNYASFDTGNIYSTATNTKTLPAALRDSRYPVIIEISDTDADKPYINQSTRYSLADADKWLADLWARYGDGICVVVVAHERDPLGTVSAIVEICRKNNSPVYTVFQNYSTATSYTMCFSEVKQTPDWEWFMQTYHLPIFAPKYPSLEIKQIIPSSTPSLTTNTTHN